MKSIDEIIADLSEEVAKIKGHGQMSVEVVDIAILLNYIESLKMEVRNNDRFR